MQIRQIFLLVSFLFLAACGFNERLSEAEGLVEDFQSLYNAQSYSRIYEELLHPEWHDYQTVGEFATFMGSLHTLGGERLSGERTTYNWKSTVQKGTSVVLRYEAQFRNGLVTETFTFRTSDGKLKLFGYKFTTDGDMKPAGGIQV